MLVRKEKAGSAPGITWDNDGDVQEVPDDLALQLLEIPGGGFTEVHQVADDPNPNPNGDDGDGDPATDPPADPVTPDEPPGDPADSEDSDQATEVSEAPPAQARTATRARRGK